LESVPTSTIFSGAARSDIVKFMPAGPPAPVHRIRFMTCTFKLLQVNDVMHLYLFLHSTKSNYLTA